MSISIAQLKSETTDVDGFMPDRLRPGLGILVIALVSGGLWYGLYSAMALLLG